MAIQKTITLNNGLTVENAYIRIGSLIGSKDKLSIMVNGYVSKQTLTEGKECLFAKEEFFTPSLENTAPNFIQQGYEYLKTLNEYQNAVDLLDEGQTV